MRLAARVGSCAGLALPHIGLEGAPCVPGLRLFASPPSCGRFNFRVSSSSGLIDALDFLLGHHVGDHALLDLREALVVGLLEGLEGTHEFVHASASSPAITLVSSPVFYVHVSFHSLCDGLVVGKVVRRNRRLEVSFVDAGAVQHGKGHQRDFPEIDVQSAACA